MTSSAQPPEQPTSEHSVTEKQAGSSAPMNLHTVTVTGVTSSSGDITDDIGEISNVEIIFTCVGDRNAPCHVYPDDFEEWSGDEDPAHPHVPHDDCWLQDWFDNDYVYPSPDDIQGGEPDGEGWTLVGQTGPIEFEYDDGVTWWFE